MRDYLLCLIVSILLTENNLNIKVLDNIKNKDI